MSDNTDTVTVMTPAGRVIGVTGKGVSAFRGIRYAEPPVGALRFAATVDASAVDVIDARIFGPVSLQDLDPLAGPIPGQENYYYPQGAVFSEDCLNLNVWVPEGADALPVYVWIHGGGFVTGSGAGPWWDGARYAHEHNMVVVTMNYRLGLLGGLWLGDIDPTISNLALQDQTSALRWIQRNISSFGGDPTRVTIGGHSAGGISVLSLITAPAARGLVAGAFIESGFPATTSIAQARTGRDEVLDALNIDRSGDVLAQLRRASTLRIQYVQRTLANTYFATFPRVGDGVTLPIDPIADTLGRPADGIPIVIGNTSEEDRLFAAGASLAGISPRPLHDQIRDMVDEEHAVRVEKAYANVGANENERRCLLTSEHNWIAPSRLFAQAWANAGNPVYHYDFAHRTTGLDGCLGASHQSDVNFWWGDLTAPGVDEILGDDVTHPALLRLAAAMAETIAALVRTGTPDRAGLGPWPAFGAEHEDTLVITAAPHVERDHNLTRLQVWGTNALTVPVLA